MFPIHAVPLFENVVARLFLFVKCKIQFMDNANISMPLIIIYIENRMNSTKYQLKKKKETRLRSNWQTEFVLIVCISCIVVVT